MCPATSRNLAKDLLHAEIKTLLGILHHKSLSIKEYQYYLTVVPMTSTELDAIDAKITAVLKQYIGIAVSTSSPFFHIDAETTHGLSVPSIRDIRTAAIIEKAHYLLNRDTPLGRIARSRARDLRDTLGWTTSLLATPMKSTPHMWRGHWIARAMHLLWETNSTIQDPQGHFNRPTNRAHDVPLPEALPADIFQMLRPQLRKHQLFWVEDVANRKGTRPTSPRLLFSKKIVYSKPSNYGLKNNCVALSGPPLGLNDYSLAPPTRRLQNKKQNSQY
jgi:hypothetical protein